MEPAEKKATLLFFRYSSIFMVLYLSYTIFIETDIYKINYPKRDPDHIQEARIGYSISDGNYFVVSNPPSNNFYFLNLLIEKKMFRSQLKMFAIIPEKYFFNRYFSTLNFLESTVLEALNLKSKKLFDNINYVGYSEKFGGNYFVFDRFDNYSIYYIHFPQNGFQNSHWYIKQDNATETEPTPIKEFIEKNSRNLSKQELSKVNIYYLNLKTELIEEKLDNIKI